MAAKTTGHTKARLTAHLLALDNGWIDEALVIFKGLKKVLEDCKEIDGVHVVVNTKGFANSAVVQYWARTRLPLRRQTPFTRGKPFHLTMDAFGPHQSDELKEILHRQDVELTIAPGKMSLFANVLDFEIIKVFKHIMRQKIRTWFESGLYTFTKQGIYRKPPYREMCMWIKETINVLNLPDNRVKWAKGFHQCGYLFYDKGMDMNILGSPHRALLTEATLKG